MSEGRIDFYINGESYQVELEPQCTLLELLRDKLQMTGTKLSCGIGACGACTVLVEGKAVNSCLTLAVTVRGKRITSIEGLSKGRDLHVVQEAFIECGAIQCGFCTPGMIMSAKSLLDEKGRPTRQEVKDALAGNLCRCTGYVKVIDAVLAAAQRAEKGGGGHER